MIALENDMYPTIRSGLTKFDVSLPEELQSYVSYLSNGSAKLGLRRRGIFCGLPVFRQSKKNEKAVIFVVTFSS